MNKQLSEDNLMKYNNQEYRNMLLCESIYLGKMIDSLPKSSVIDRMSLQARKHKIDAEIIDMQVANLKKLESPHLYVKPKRWVAEYTHGAGCWIITDNRTNLSAMGTILTSNNDAHHQAAERIAAILEEVMP